MTAIGVSTFARIPSTRCCYSNTFTSCPSPRQQVPVRVGGRHTEMGAQAVITPVTTHMLGSLDAVAFHDPADETGRQGVLLNESLTPASGLPETATGIAISPL